MLWGPAPRLRWRAAAAHLQRKRDDAQVEWTGLPHLFGAARVLGAAQLIVPTNEPPNQRDDVQVG